MRLLLGLGKGRSKQPKARIYEGRERRYEGPKNKGPFCTVERALKELRKKRDAIHKRNVTATPPKKGVDKPLRVVSGETKSALQ